MGWAATRSQIFQAKRLEDLASGLWDNLTNEREQKARNLAVLKSGLGGNLLL